MIELSADTLEALERVEKANDDFVALLKGIATAQSGMIVLPPRDSINIHASLLLHLTAHIVGMQAEIQQLQGQLAIHVAEEHTK